MSEYKMPSLGADMKDAILIEWYVKPGDVVKRGDVIADLETDKGDIDVEVFEDGVIEQLIAKPGDKLPVGAILANIKSKGDKPIVKKEEKEQTITEELPMVEVKEPVVVHEKSNGQKRLKASPLARKMAESLAIDLSKLTGTGEGGVIHKIDVENYAKVASGETRISTLEKPVTKVEKSEPPVSRMRRAIASAMTKSNTEIPHYYLESEIDMSDSLAWLIKKNAPRPVKDRMLPIALQVKAMALALADTPEFNAYWESGQLLIQESINIGLTISLRQGGLVVPAIADADQKSLEEIMDDVLDITQRTRTGELKTSDLTSATITLTNLGDRGVQTVYGVIYPPQVAIVGMGKVTNKPWAEQNMLGIKPILTVTLAADHRATDGHLGGRFLQRLNDYLQKPEKL